MFGERFLQEVGNFFIYNPEKPFIFTSSTFWLFFIAILAVYQFTYQSKFKRNFFLLLFSFFFYYKAGGLYFFLLVFSTIVDHFFGKQMYETEKKGYRTFLLVCSLSVNLGVLSYYKYAYLFTDFINYLFHTSFETQDYLAQLGNVLLGRDIFAIDDIFLPIGISFYTFQTMSYSIDIYRGKLKPVESVLDFAFFVSFFPQLVAGPIVRASEFIPQIYKKYTLSKAEYEHAIFLILNGLVKKMLISDYISINFVDRVFSNPPAYTGFENLLAVYGYAIQIYCDFSGYTDIAIGIALLLGYRLPLNFNSPYKADSITNFWRRWHISLSSWLRDYLYISLGGNRTTSLFTYISVPLTLVILLMLDGWHWLNVGLFVAIGLLWWIWRKTKKNWLAFVALHVVLVSILYLIQRQSWYLAGMWAVIFIFWVIILIKPEKQRAISTYMNLMITMLLGGLWHGAHIKFIIWGALHGGALAVHKFWMEVTNSDKKSNHNLFYRFFMQVITFHFVCFCWIFFRANDVKIGTGVTLSAMEVVRKILWQIGTSFQPQLIWEVIVGYKEFFIIMTFGYIIHWLPQNWKVQLQQTFAKAPDYAKALIIVVIVLGLYQAKSSDIQPFIYFQF